MINHLRSRLRRTPLREILLRWRYRDIQDSDVFFASYPKSGSTWLSFMLAHLLSGRHQERCDPDSKYLPGVGCHSSALACLPCSGRLIRTHERFRHCCKRAIILVRDGRDVAVSYYYHVQRQDNYHQPFDTFLRSFLRGTIDGYGPWHAHTVNWLDCPLASTESLCIVRYEDLKRECETELRRIANFLDLHVSHDMIAAAIASSNFEAMRKREERGAIPQGQNSEVSFVRKGAVGDWRNHFSAEEEQLFQSTAGAALKQLERVKPSRLATLPASTP